MLTAAALLLAAIAEIAGCFAVWAVLRNGANAWWLAPAAAALAVFAVALTWVPTDAAGRLFAAYGGVYVAASLTWMVVVEGKAPRAADLVGVGLCLIGAAVILWNAPKSS